MRCRINQGQAQAPEKAMKLYAVRMIETCQPVGLFWAKDVSDLVVAIDFDDVMSPTRCEYLTIETTGALVWYDHESWQLGGRQERRTIWRRLSNALSRCARTSVSTAAYSR
jgi:hypothetical protein